MSEAIHDDGHEWNGYRRDGRDGDLSSRGFSSSPCLGLWRPSNICALDRHAVHEDLELLPAPGGDTEPCAHLARPGTAVTSRRTLCIDPVRLVRDAGFDVREARHERFPARFWLLGDHYSGVAFKASSPTPGLAAT